MAYTSQIIRKINIEEKIEPWRSSLLIDLDEKWSTIKVEREREER